MTVRSFAAMSMAVLSLCLTSNVILAQPVAPTEAEQPGALQVGVAEVGKQSTT